MNLQRFSFLLRTLASRAEIVFFYTPAAVVATIAVAAVPFVTGRFIDSLAYGNSPYAYFALLVTLLLTESIALPLLGRLILAASRKVELSLQIRALDSIMGFPPAKLGTIDQGSLVAKLTRDTYALGNFVRNFYPRIIQSVIMTIAVATALSIRSIILGIAFMVLVPLTIFAFAPFARKFAANSERVRKNGDRAFSGLFDFFFSLPYLRLLDAERRFADTPTSALKALKDGNHETDSLSTAFRMLLAVPMVVGEIAILAFAGREAMRGTIPIGDVVMYQMLFISAIQAVNGLIGMLPELASINEGVTSLAEILAPKANVQGKIPIASLESLSFRNIAFAYPNSSGKNVVRNFSAEFRADEIVALTGANGAGKSTLLKLAVNALEPSSGEILVNGKHFDEIDVEALRRRIGIVFQDNFIVRGTIRDNITLRDPRFSESDIEKAVAASGFGEVVKRFPDGLDTEIGDNFRTLSGGERQRLAVARAIIRDPLILVLDEATNHLDAASRRTLYASVAKLRQNRLILIAGHDEEMEKICDRKISCQIS